MNSEEKIKLFQDVFAPKPGEKVLVMYDIPHGNVKDNDKWKERREMAKDWYEIFKKMGDSEGFTVDIFNYKSAGLHNTQIPKEITDKIRKYNLVIVIMEF